MASTSVDGCGGRWVEVSSSSGGPDGPRVGAGKTTLTAFASENVRLAVTFPDGETVETLARILLRTRDVATAGEEEIRSLVLRPSPRSAIAISVAANAKTRKPPFFPNGPEGDDLGDVLGLICWQWLLSAGHHAEYERVCSLSGVAGFKGDAGPEEGESRSASRIDESTAGLNDV